MPKNNPFLSLYKSVKGALPQTKVNVAPPKQVPQEPARGAKVKVAYGSGR